jgi:L,D-transpeptidase catalytic domain
VRKLALLGLALLAAGCGAHRAARTTTARTAAGGVLATRARLCTAGEVLPLGNARKAYVGVATHGAVAERKPSGAAVARFGAKNVNDYPTIFGVVGAVVRRDCTPSWYRVQIPVRPNGATAFVRASRIELQTIDVRIDVDVSARRLVAYRAGRPILRTTVAVGSPRTPTPLGRFYVNQRLVPEDTSGPFGRDRDLGVLERAHRLDTGRARRDSRHERAVVDRPRRLERLHPRAELDAPPAVAAGGRRDAGDNPCVRRLLAVLALVAFAAGAAAWRLADVKPDPNVQADADGCQRDTTKIYTGLAPNWVYVNDRDFPASGPAPAPRWVGGVVGGATGLLASRVASSDDPITHRSYDANVDVRVDHVDDFLTGVSRDTTTEAGTIHLERESGSFPLWAWPQPGDRVQALGSWVWDCDHYQGTGEKTEFHPFRAVWVARHAAPHGRSEGDLYVASDATPAGTEAECAHRTKGDATFKSCAHAAADWLDVNGDYSFRLCGARGGAITSADMGSVGAPRIAIARTPDGCATVSFTIAAPQGRRVIVAKRILLGTPPRLDHLRVRFENLLVRRAMDPSGPAESTLTGQIAKAPGEWQLYWSVNGIWGRWPGTLAARDGSVFRGRQSVDFFVAHGAPWTLVTLARECDFGALPGWDGPGHPTAPCPQSSEVGNAKGDDYPGAITATFHGDALGRHVSNASTAGSTCPPVNTKGCYQLTYTVSRVR